MANDKVQVIVNELVEEHPDLPLLEEVLALLSSRLRQLHFLKILEEKRKPHG